MKHPQFLLGGWPRRHQQGIVLVKCPVTLEKIEGVLQPYRPHGVIPAQLVVGQSLVVDKCGFAAHNASWYTWDNSDIILVQWVPG
jgi:hypothetical protein